MAAPAEPEKSYFARRNWKIFKDCEGPPKAPQEIINICLLLFHFQLNSTRRRRTRCYQNGNIKGVFVFVLQKASLSVFLWHDYGLFVWILELQLKGFWVKENVSEMGEMRVRLLRSCSEICIWRPQNCSSVEGGGFVLVTFSLWLALSLLLNFDWVYGGQRCSSGTSKQ